MYIAIVGPKAMTKCPRDIIYIIKKWKQKKKRYEIYFWDSQERKFD